MKNYNIYAATENEKYKIMRILRDCGAIITAVSGCGPGYYIQLDATAAQAAAINKALEAAGV